MKDAFAPGPLDESYVVSLGPIFDFALKDITGYICGQRNFQDGTEGSVCE